MVFFYDFYPKSKAAYPLKTQKHIGYILLFTFLATLFFLYSTYQNNQRANTTFQWVSQTHNVIELIDQVNASIINLESHIRGYVISGNPIFLKDLKEKEADIYHHLEALRQSTRDNPHHQHNLDTLQQLAHQKIVFQDQVIVAYQQSRGEALQLIASLRGKNLSDELQRILGVMQKKEQEILALRMEQSKSITSNKFISTVVVGLAAFIFITIALLRMNREIRLRKKAERVIKNNEAKYRSLIENAAVIVFTVDKRGRFTYISSKCKAITGYEVHELIGQHFTHLIAESEKANVVALYLAQYKSKMQENVIAFPIRTKTGEEKWLEQSVVLLQEEGQHIGFQCFARDITEEKQAEERASIAEQKVRTEQAEYQFRMKAVLDNIPMIVYIKDLEGRFIMVNRRFREVFEMTDEMILGKKSNDVYKNEKRNGNFIAADEKVKQTLEPVEAEDMLMTKDGERHVLVTKFPLLDKNKQLFAICGVDKDITEMARNREQLLAAKQRAERAERLQEEFLANMSHEIRTPMNGIVGMANLLDETSLTSEQKEFVQIIRQSSDTLLVLINDILDLSKIKAGRMGVEQIAFSIPDVIDSVMSPMLVKTHQKGVLLQKSMDAQLPQQVKGDRHKLAQILNNLLSNAVKFTDSGKIELQVQVLEQTPILATIAFRVKDTGMGIAADYLDYIFESFAQAGDDMIRRFGGTGLGLAITKRLVELQGGTIEVTSELGKGTSFCFVITYNLCTAEEEVKTEPHFKYPHANRQSLAGKKILLVEDNVVNQKVTLLMLQKAGMEIEVAQNGKEAVDKLERGGRYDLIIMDLQMPEMNGFQATTYIRKKLHLSLPIIAMTASALRNEKMKCFELGMNEYLTKPFVPADLFRHLHRFLQPGAAGADNEGKVKEVFAKNELYSLSYLQEMEDDEYVAEVLQVFLETSPSQLEEMRQNVLYENWPEVHKNAHKLKSSFGFLQMNQLLNDVTAIEALAKQQTELEKLPQLLKRLQQQYDLIKPMLEADLQKARQMHLK